MNNQRLRVAVVGCGVAGLTAAHVLQRRHEVTIFERNDYAGGHTHTIDVTEPDGRRLPVDTGFIVLNDRTYPCFRRLLGQLGVGLHDTTMSFGFHDERTGFHYAGTNLNGLFAQRRNLWRPRYWRMLFEIFRFCGTARERLRADDVPRISIGEYLELDGHSRDMIESYLVPMTAAIWSTDPGKVLDFPAAALLRFFENHGLLAIQQRPQWQTVSGGSHAYVRAFLDRFPGTVYLNTPIQAVRRRADGVTLKTGDGAELGFDAAVIAAHADEAWSLLADPCDLEARWLRPWRYQRNRTVLHTDSQVLPPVRRAWACWNYARERAANGAAPVSVTYWMNRLQGLESARDYCVTLNRQTPIADAAIIGVYDYMHPTYTFASMDTQEHLGALNGRRHTYFCGSYFGYGFHEDAVRSGVQVAQSMGLDL